MGIISEAVLPTPCILIEIHGTDLPCVSRTGGCPFTTSIPRTAWLSFLAIGARKYRTAPAVLTSTNGICRVVGSLHSRSRKIRANSHGQKSQWNWSHSSALSARLEEHFSFPVLTCMRPYRILRVAPVSASTSEVWTLTMLLLSAARQTLTPLQRARCCGSCIERAISPGYQKRLPYSTIQMRPAEGVSLILSRSWLHPAN